MKTTVEALTKRWPFNYRFVILRRKLPDKAIGDGPETAAAKRTAVVNSPLQKLEAEVAELAAKKGDAIREHGFVYQRTSQTRPNLKNYIKSSQTKICCGYGRSGIAMDWNSIKTMEKKISFILKKYQRLDKKLHINTFAKQSIHELLNQS